MASLAYLEGKTICVVFCRIANEDKDGRLPLGLEPQYEFKTMQGRASIVQHRYLEVIEHGGARTFRVPPSAYRNIFPNDGTPMIGNAEYFVMVKVSGIPIG